MAHTVDLQEELYQEIVARIQQDDVTAPAKLGEYYYYTRYREGGEYGIYCRRRGSMEGAEEVLLDANARGEGHEFFDVGGNKASPDQCLYGWAEDIQGRHFFTLRFKDLSAGELLEDVITDVTANFIWAEDGQTIFYIKQEPKTLRWYRLYKHVLGTDPADDVLIYEEADETFNIWVTKSRSRHYILMGAWQSVSTEYRFIPADQPDADWLIFEPRRRDHQYNVSHAGDRFYVRSNDEAQNFRLFEVSADATGREHWREVIPHRGDVLLERAVPFSGHLVVTERQDGLRRLRVIRRENGATTPGGRETLPREANYSSNSPARRLR